MSAIENNVVSRPGAKRRLNKKDTRVDLTPMVDLGFLLITFFVVTTQLSLPTVMKLNMPYDKVPASDHIGASCVLTLLLQPGNTIQYYEGFPQSNTVVRQTSFAPEGIRNIILQKKKDVEKIKGKEDDFVLIIKPADGSTFQNFVDIVDEVAINNVKHYYMDEITAEDKKLFSKK
ncbi:MAG: biopolymer transporter ExbD [Ferruginibacter sp.]